MPLFCPCSQLHDTESGLYYLQSRYYDPKVGRFLNADTTDYLGADGTPISYNLFAYCKNNPVIASDPTGHFLLSTAVLIGAVVGGVIGAAIGGTVSYKVAEKNGAEGWELAGWTALGALGGGAVGAAAGGAIGYGVGYFAGGTYANGLAAKSVNKAIKSFFSQPNKVHKMFKLARHNLAGYTENTAAKLMKDTLAKGVVGAYKTVQKAAWTVMNSEVTFTVIDGEINVSDMWIK